MSQHSFHVMIIGGGLGGLCLAQGLKKAGISVAVYERDRTRNERLQGYRIHIEAMGNRALHDCLPSHLFEAYLKATGSAGSGLLMCDEQLNHLMAFPVDVAKQDDPLESSRSVSRITLRQVLLAELDEIVQFDKCYSHYQENPDGSVTAFFEDGTSATGDLLVAADGGNSRVRQQFLPQASRVETGTVAIMGKVPLTPMSTRCSSPTSSTEQPLCLAPKVVAFSLLFTTSVARPLNGPRARLAPMRRPCLKRRARCSRIPTITTSGLSSPNRRTIRCTGICNPYREASCSRWLRT